VNWLSTWWQQVSATVASGLQITVIGMALVFLTLGLVIVALIVLTRLPGRSRSANKDQDVTTDELSGKPVVAPATGAGLSATEQAQNAELAQVAAIAVALLRSRRTRPPRAGTKSETSRWRQYGRAHQLGL
jgi:Na+-transporting methylmalonyl-CoA/oxaloacetate decarboxylase gamma subunit